MEQTDSLRGSWSGQLIDIGGFEGQITLTLRNSAGSIDGSFDAVFAGQHHGINMRGLVTGKLANRRLMLKLDVGRKDSPVLVEFDGNLLETRQRIPAVCGSYTVSARQVSPLMGGILCASQGKLVAQAQDERVSITALSPRGSGGLKSTKLAATARKIRVKKAAGRSLARKSGARKRS